MNNVVKCTGKSGELRVGQGRQWIKSRPFTNSSVAPCESARHRAPDDEEEGEEGEQTESCGVRSKSRLLSRALISGEIRLFLHPVKSV